MRTWKVQCDRTGFEVESNKVTREWTGLIVLKTDADERHPQEFVRGKRDRQRVKDPRPEPADSFVNLFNTTLSADEAAGQTVLSVTSSANFTAGNYVNILLDDDTIHRTTIASVDSSIQITIAAALPGKASSGNNVTDLGSAP